MTTVGEKGDGWIPTGLIAGQNTMFVPVRHVCESTLRTQKKALWLASAVSFLLAGEPLLDRTTVHL